MVKNNMFKKLLIISLYLLPVQLFAEDKIVTIVASEYPPFEYKDANGDIKGIDADTVLEVFKNSGYEVKFRVEPWLRAVELVKNGEVDAIISVEHSPEHDTIFLPSDPISYTQNFFFKKKDLKINPKNITELNSYNIATIAGYPYGTKFDDAKFAHLDPITSNDPQADNLKKLEAGRVDLMVCEVNTCLYYMSQDPKLSNIDYIESLPIDDVSPYYMGFSRKNMARSAILLQDFNLALKAYIAGGKRDKNLAKYKLKNLQPN